MMIDFAIQKTFWTWTVALCFALLSLTSSAQAETASTCLGDCGGDGQVTVDEILIMLNIALGEATVTDCGSGDGNQDGQITVDEILSAVTNALDGCTTSPGALGRRVFTIDSLKSNFESALDPNFIIPLGRFRGQKDGETDDAFFVFEAGEPNEDGVALIDIVDGSDFLHAEVSLLGDFVLCVKPIIPAPQAGRINCNGGDDLSLLTELDHNLGEIGVEGFNAADCSAAGGTLEGPNQVCASGLIGEECFEDLDCSTDGTTDDGVCGLEENTCTEGNVGASCRNFVDCDSEQGADDGICGVEDPHPGLCNGQVLGGQVGEDSGVGAVIVADQAENGTLGLPAELIFESALPCGDEGGGMSLTFAMTTGTSTSTIRNLSGTSSDLSLTRQGENFSCTDWSNPIGPGAFVLSFPTLHQNPMGGGDIITAISYVGKRE